MKKWIIALSMCCVFMSNCDKKSSTSPTEEAAKDLSFSVMGDQTYIILVHSEDGKTISDVLELSDGDVQAFPDFERKYVSFTVFTKPTEETTSNNLTTYYGVPTDNFNFAATALSNVTTINAKLDIGMQNYIAYGLMGPNRSTAYGGSSMHGPQTMQINLFSSYPAVLIAYALDMSGNQGFYGIVKDFPMTGSPEDTVTIPVYKAMQEKTVHSSKSASMLSITPICKCSDGDFYSLSQGISIGRGATNNVTTFHIPEPPADYYNTAISSYDQIGGWSMSQISKEIPTEMDIPTGYIAGTLTGAGISNIMSNGECDYFRANLYDRYNPTILNWQIYTTPTATSIAFPVLPDSIMKMIDCNRINFSDISLYGVNIGNLDGYNEFIQDEFNGSDEIIETTSFYTYRSLESPTLQKPNPIQKPMYNPLLKNIEQF